MRKNIFIQAMMAGLLISCSHNQPIAKDYNVENIFVPIKTPQCLPADNYSDFIDSVKYISLQTADSCLLGNIKESEMYFIDNHLYMADNKSVFIFDAEGNFIRKISRKGRGRGEYLTLSHFDVNPTNKEISILDEGGRCIIIYTNEGKFLRKVTLGENIPRDFAVQSNGDYLFFTPDEYAGTRGLWKVDKWGEDKQELVGISEKHKYVIRSLKYFSHINDSTIGLMGIEDEDIIYHIIGDSVSVAYKLQFDMKNPQKYVSKKFTPQLSEKVKGKLYTKSGYIESERFIRFDASIINTYNMAIHYDKINHQTYSLILGCQFNLGEKMETYFPFRSGNNNVLIGYATPDMIVPEIKKRLFPNLKEDSNPCICLYFLKKE